MRRTAVLLAALPLLLTGCGGDGGGGGDAGTSAETPEPVDTDPTLPVEFALVEAATADLPTDADCAAWAWGTNSTGAEGAIDFRQLDCYPNREAVSVGAPSLVQTMVWVELASPEAASAYADAEPADAEVLLAGPTVVVLSAVWASRDDGVVDEVVAEIQAACGCGVRRG